MDVSEYIKGKSEALNIEIPEELRAKMVETVEDP